MKIARCQEDTGGKRAIKIHERARRILVNFAGRRKRNAARDAVGGTFSKVPPTPPQKISHEEIRVHSRIVGGNGVVPNGLSRAPAPTVLERTHIVGD